MSSQLKLGIIGLSQGNGHPYSWSAICNGYDQIEMAKCEFASIPNYLNAKSYPSDFIHNAIVSHVWTQDYVLSQKIANASNIKNIVSDFRDLIGVVDAVLLARDDAQSHYHFSRPFLDAGIPIFIDKPLALSVSEASTLLALQHYPGQLFSCSALRFANEFRPRQEEIDRLGDIKYVICTVPKDWDKYAIHAIDPLLSLFPALAADEFKKTVWRSSVRTVLHVESSFGIEFEVRAMGNHDFTVSILIVGAKESMELTLSDTFDAFKSCLQTFIDLTCTGKIALTPEQMLASIRLVEAGRY